VEAADCRDSDSLKAADSEQLTAGSKKLRGLGRALFGFAMHSMLKMFYSLQNE
jgi:hypothetical protein